MKKSTLITLTDYFKGTDVPAELVDAVADLNAERAKNEEKAQANRSLYASAYEPVMAVLDSTPKTVAEIFDACKPALPADFSKSKLQYAIREYWNADVVRHENGKDAYTYTKA